MMQAFDRDLGDQQVRCWLQISEACLEVLDSRQLTVDRVTPERGYVRSNIQPACRPCQNRQGALISWERRQQWQAWREEADAAGIEWSGAM